MANKHLKPSLLTSAVAAGLVAVPMSASAQNLNLKISGQINKTIGFIDNGDSSALGFFDNSNSGSRFRFTGSQDMGNGMSVGGVWEWQWGNSVQGNATFNAGGEFSESSAGLKDRKTELYYQGGWGKISLGKGDGAANGTAEVDLSGTTTIDYAGGNQCLLGSMTYGTGSSTVTSVTVGATYSQFDGESRNTRIRYDTPKMGWGGIAVSLGNQGLIEAAYRGSWNIGNGKFAVAGGITDTGDRPAPTPATDTNRKRTAVSGSYLLGMGLNFTVSYSTNDPEATGSVKSSLTYFKIGWKKGKHAVSLSLGESKNRSPGFGTVTSSDATSTTLAYNYKPAKFAEVYAGFRVSDSDISGLEKVTALNVGSRIKWK